MTQVILYDQKFVHIDGYKEIINFDSEKMCIKCKQNNLNIYGRNLRIDSFSGIEMIISGCIYSISWSN